MSSNLNTKNIIIIILALLVLGFVFMRPQNIPQTEVVSTVPVMSGNVDDLVSLSIAPNQSVSGLVALSGSVKNAYFFEANIVLKVVDTNNNNLLTTFGTATTEWMTTEPVSFTANIDFTGLPTGPAYLVIENDNPSGDPGLTKQIIIPIVIN